MSPPRPPAIHALDTDPRFDLHDGRFHEVLVDPDARQIVMAIDCGDLELGYRRLTLTFIGAIVTPDDLHLLAEAVGAEFRANHWHRGRAVTEIVHQQVTTTPDGRFVLRLRLWPFHAFAIEFGSLSIAEAPLDARRPARSGHFVVRGTPARTRR